MAVGLGRMFGFEFMKNFDAPYRAESITDFWRRWHISLSTFLRDYLYIPLGGNRGSSARTYANLAIVMLLGAIVTVLRLLPKVELGHSAAFKRRRFLPRTPSLERRSRAQSVPASAGTNCGTSAR